MHTNPYGVNAQPYVYYAGDQPADMTTIARTFPGCTHLNGGAGYSYSGGNWAWVMVPPTFPHWPGRWRPHVNPIAAAINAGYLPAVGQSLHRGVGR